MIPELDPEYGAIMTIGGRYYSRYHPKNDVKTFWAAAERHELLIKNCKKCNAMIHPSRQVCPKCLSIDLSWIKSGGKGSVYTYSVIHYAYIPEFKDKVPYIIVLVMLDERVPFYSILVNCDPSKVKIGMRVEAVFDNENLFHVTLPKFRPVEGLLRQ